jgi:hypothetical protein
MNIEDLIVQASIYSFLLNLNQWDFQAVHSLAGQISQGIAFTEKQRLLSLRILKKHVASLSTILNMDLSASVLTPTFKSPIRVISNDRKMEISNNETFGKVIKVKFPYDDKLISLIREHKGPLDTVIWNKEEKLWVFSLSEKNISFLLDLNKDDIFEIDETLSLYFQQMRNVFDQPEKYVPMLVIEDDYPKFTNVLKSVPQCSSRDILSALFEARKRGIFTWDEQIEYFLNHGNINSFTKNFLSSDPGTPLYLNCKNNDINNLTDIVKYMNPCIFIIPGVDEMLKLKQAFNFLKDLGFKNTEMSVLFRLPKENGKEFNEFIKEHKLNSPIHQDTKIVFISGKMRKAIAESKIKFHSAIHLGSMSAHYTIKNLLQNQENLIYFSPKSLQREIFFADM